MVCVLLANGFEEIEALTQVDYLRRAGIETVTAGVEGMTVEGGHGIKVLADVPLAAIEKEKLEMVVVPGGLGGVKGVSESETACDLVRYAYENAILAAICAAPSLTAKLGCVEGRKSTVYPGMDEAITANGGTYEDQAVVCDGNLITGRSAGAAEEFAFALITALRGKDAAEKVRHGIVAR